VGSSLALMAGSVSTAVFVASTLPMLMKAGRTKNLASYSLGNIVLANVGNLIYAIYVVSLPFGPVWALHGFHLGATGLMLFWYVRHSGHSQPHTMSRVGRRAAQEGESATRADRPPSSLLRR
jgi:uncharacterized protein with PQ loop repeat